MRPTVRMRRAASDCRCRSRRGLALVATLALLTLLTAMIAVAVRGNVEQRKYIRLRQDAATALCLAEAGVNEAIRAISRKTGQTAIERANETGAFRVEWRPATAGNDTYEVDSLGVSHPDDPLSPRRAVRVRAHVPAGGPARALSWEMSAGGGAAACLRLPPRQDVE